MKHTRHLLIVGAGQLGSRHLQSLAQICMPSIITVVDPSTDSICIAKERYEEIKTVSNIDKIFYVDKILDVHENVDFCVIATNAKYRLVVLTELLEKLTVKNIILEKVLFQSEEQLNKAAKLLSDYGVNAWVNCPLRMYPFYLSLKDKLVNEESISLSVEGENWGLACNAIHFIDLWSFLSGFDSYSINTEQLDRNIVDSKRAGYKEVFGTLTGQQGDSKFSLKCTNQGDKFIRAITIKTDNFLIDINEAEGSCIIEHVVSGVIENIQYHAPMQSQLTHLVAEEVLNTGSCNLTPYAVSAKLHGPLLKSLLKFFNENSESQYEECPIT